MPVWQIHSTKLLIPPNVPGQFDQTAVTMMTLFLDFMTIQAPNLIHVTECCNSCKCILGPQVHAGTVAVCYMLYNMVTIGVDISKILL